MDVSRADNYRVLLVEDEMEIAEMLAIFFSGHGLTLYHAATGDEALSRAISSAPHVILMDITLPDRDGYEVCKQLRQQPRTAHIPIIFLTRRSGRNDKLSGLELGADDFISKPFDLQELLLRVRNSIQRAAREAEIDPRTGLPSARALRSQIETARIDPSRAVIELALDHVQPFRDAYGTTKVIEASVFLAKLLQEAVAELGHVNDSIGYLGDLQYVAVCDSNTAEAIIARVLGKFDDRVLRYYQPDDVVDHVFMIQGTPYPLLRVISRLFALKQPI
jgi:DNA-binding response OmpR family regulator